MDFSVKLVIGTIVPCSECDDEDVDEMVMIPGRTIEIMEGERDMLEYAGRTGKIVVEETINGVVNGVL